MAVTISLVDLAVHLRVTIRPGATIDDGERLILENLLHTSTDAVNAYVDDAPDPTSNEAVIRMAGHLFDQPAHNRNPQNAFVTSGARSLLSPWHVPKSSRVI